MKMTRVTLMMAGALTWGAWAGAPKDETKDDTKVEQGQEQLPAEQGQEQMPEKGKDAKVDQAQEQTPAEQGQEQIPTEQGQEQLPADQGSEGAEVSDPYVLDDGESYDEPSIHRRRWRRFSQVTCYARDRFGRLYAASGIRPYNVQNRALNRCLSLNRFYYSGCRALGCRSAFRWGWDY
jgi:hypothetical protein